MIRKNKKLCSLILSALIMLTGCTAPSSSIQKVPVTLDDTVPLITINPIENLSDDFILGCDVSSLISEESSDVKFYNNDKEEQDPLLTLAQNGVNTIRIRIWNDPYDSEGNGYGGGNCNVENAIKIGKRATMYGMDTMIDFHYSDFWADPGKQMCPKDWTDMNISEKSTALYDYTYDSLKKILDAGINVNIVQIGNETTSGIAGETDWKNITTLMNSGSKAVRDISKKYNQDIQVALHFTNPEKTDAYRWFSQTLNTYNVDYDIFASSYYPMWHGTITNLTEILTEISNKYNKKVMVAEFSYPYTYKNGDTFNNSISKYSECDFPYPATVQGQADCISDIAKAVSDVGEAGIGICYWEPAWLPVTGSSYDEQLAIWEKHGSGWASSYSKEYDPYDAGKYYGGSSWDNQALFDFKGYPLESLSTFRLLRSKNK